MLVVEGNRAHLLLHVSNILEVVLVNGHIVLLQLSYQLVSDILTCKVELVDSMRHSIALKHWDCIGNTLTTLNDHSSGFTR